MKVKIGVTTILSAVLIVVGIQKTALAQDNVPLPFGTYSITDTGLLTVCLNPTTFATEACTTKGVLAVPLSLIEVGTVTYDGKGHGCLSETATVAVFPADASTIPPTTNQNEVWTTTDYDPTNGTGDMKLTVYVGGHCIGSTFDKTGATLTASGTTHFAQSDYGRRIDLQYTSLTNPANTTGAISLHAVDRKLQ
jgi:hypothetical protein